MTISDSAIEAAHLVLQKRRADRHSVNITHEDVRESLQAALAVMEREKAPPPDPEAAECVNVLMNLPWGVSTPIITQAATLLAKYADENRQLRDQIALLAQTSNYAVHADHCNVFNGADCTCGLAKLDKQISAALSAGDQTGD